MSVTAGPGLLYALGTAYIDGDLVTSRALVTAASRDELIDAVLYASGALIGATADQVIGLGRVSVGDLSPSGRRRLAEAWSERAMTTAQALAERDR